MKRAAIVMVAAVAIAAFLVFPVSASDNYFVYGAQKKSSYTKFSNSYSDSVYIVDDTDWFMGNKPFSESPDELYFNVWSYIPCVADHPVSYSTQILQCYSEVTTDTGVVGRTFYYDLSTRAVASADGGMVSQMSISEYYVNTGGVAVQHNQWQFTQGVDFDESFIFIGCEFVMDRTETYGYSLIFFFLADGELTGVNTGDVDRLYQYIYFGSESSFDYYTFAFSTTAEGSWSTSEFEPIFRLLFDKLKDSENFLKWYNSFYTTLDDDTLESVNEILDVINQPSHVPAPEAQKPSSDIQNNMNSVSNVHGGVGGTFDSYFDQATSALDDLTSKVVDTADFLTLNSIFSWTVMQILELPKFIVIVDALVFAFVLWVLGLNLGSIFKNNDRGDHNARND